MRFLDKVFEGVPHFHEVFPDQETFLIFACVFVAFTFLAAIWMAKRISIKSADPTDHQIPKKVKRS